MTSESVLQGFLIVAGLGQLGLVAGSLVIPKVMKWSEALAPVPQDVQRMFWVYGAYIWCFHLAFGLLSSLAPTSLFDGSVLATSVSGFIFVYWGARIAIQFFYFDSATLAPTPIKRVGLLVLEICFWGWTLVYGAALYANVIGL